jgi:phasin family protein
MNTNTTAAVQPQAIAATPSLANDASVIPTQIIEAAFPMLTPPAIQQGMKAMIDNTKEYAAISKDNLEAFAAVGKIWAAGVQDLTKQVAAAATGSFEESVATLKALGAVRSIREAIDLQSAYGKTLVANMLAESKRLTDASLKLTEQAMQPLTARMAVAVGALAKAA